MDQEQLFTAVQVESVNFYSLNVHGIRELLIEVAKRIHTTGFEIALGVLPPLHR